MQEFSKIYLPILGVVLIFSGFWYVKAYFSFFAMNEVIPTLSLDYIGQFSFSVVFELLTFENVWRSIQFVIMVLFLLFVAYVIPNWSFHLPKAKRIWGTDSIPIAPFWLRLILAAGVSFCWIFVAAHNIGTAHACRFLQGRINLTTTVDAVFSAEDYSAFYQAFGYEAPDSSQANTNPPQITEVWRNSDFVYMVKREANCETERIVVKIPSDRFPIIRLNLEKQ